MVHWTCQEERRLQALEPTGATLCELAVWVHGRRGEGGVLTVVEVVEEGCGTGAGAAVGGGSGSAAPLWSGERKTPCGLRKICEEQERQEG